MLQLFCIYTLADFAFRGWNLCKSVGSGESVQIKVRIDLYCAVFSSNGSLVLCPLVLGSVCVCARVCVFVGCVCPNGDVSSCFLMSACLLDLIKQKTATHLPC